MKAKQLIAMLLVCVIAGVCVGLAVRSRNGGGVGTIEQPSGVQNVQNEPVITTVKMLAVGDNLIHKPIYQQAQARTGDGSYDFMPVYSNIKSIISAADIAVVNQETMMASSFDVSTYPTFNTPTVMAKTLADLGFDVLTIANNHMLDKQSKGLIETLDLINSTQGLIGVGAYHNRDAYKQIKTLTKNGITFAFLSYTEHTNGITLPEDKEDYIIYLDETDDVKLQVEYAKTIADVVVVSMHAGTEYADDENDVQREFAKNVAEWGADVVIGTHPHTLQPVKYIQTADGRQVPVMYSLGNFCSAQDKARRLIGGMAYITFTKNSATGEVTVSKPQLDIAITHYSQGFAGLKLYRLADYPVTQAASHGNSSLKHEYIYEHIREIIGNEYLIDEYKSVGNTESNTAA